MKINLNGKWRLYSRRIPAHSRAIGTVTRDGCDTGALVLMATGLYVQANAGVIRSLPQALVAAALASTNPLTKNQLGETK